MPRFEHAKELLSYNEKTPKKIAQNLDYASRKYLGIKFN